MTDQKKQSHQPQQGKTENDSSSKNKSQNQPGKSSGDTGKGHDPHKMTGQHQSSRSKDQDVDMDADSDPDKSTEVGDDTEQTKKKIPNMHK